MSYAIVRNEKLTRSQAQGICVHNDRKAKNHSNKEIDISKTHLNYYLKKNELNYIKEFDRLKEENNLKGQIRSNSIIICEMIFTSDKEFFEKIGLNETKRYFEESYKFISKYKNLGKKNIISAVIHLDEGTPHMHLAYIPVIHTTDKQGNPIDKICARDFWQGRDSYRKLQNAYFEYVSSKGFELERGLPSEETGRKHEKIQDFKQITNFENTQKILKNITLELPEVPDINDIKLIKLNKEKVTNEIIKPQNDLILKLYDENVSLYKELSKQVNVVNEATKYVKERNSILNENYNLNSQLKELKRDYNIKLDNMEYSYERKINKLEKEINFLEKVVDRFKITVSKFIHWICDKFSVSSEDMLIRDFEKETHNNFNIEKQIKYEQNKENEYDLEF